jgi:DNA-binding CsgD family transcriptional regulator
VALPQGVSGESLLSPTITRRMIEVHLDHVPSGLPPVALDLLTPREREILVLLSRALSNAEIADHLVVSETTVKTHVARVLMQLGLRDRVQAVIFAYESGVVLIGHRPMDARRPRRGVGPPYRARPWARQRGRERSFPRGPLAQDGRAVVVGLSRP